MSTNQQSRKAARAKRRAERKATRERRRRERDAAGISASLTATPDDPVTKPGVMPAHELRRRRAFELLEQTHSELVGIRQRQVIELFLASPGSEEHTQLGREVEALNDELDELRELSDELLRKVAPFDVAEDRLAQLEALVIAAQALASASERAQALLGAAEQLLAALDDALEINV